MRLLDVIHQSNIVAPYENSFFITHDQYAGANICM